MVIRRKFYMNNIPSTKGNSFFSKLKAFLQKIFKKNRKLELPQENHILENNRIVDSRKYPELLIEENDYYIYKQWLFFRCVRTRY